MNFTLNIGGAEAAGFFKEATGFDSESEVTEIGTDVGASSKREGIELDSRPASLLEIVSR